MIAVEETTEEVLEEMPTYNHSYVCLEIIIQILALGKFRPLPELTLNIGNGITPDISVYPVTSAPKPDFFSDIFRYDVMPILAIEVISPSQNIQDLLEKAKLLNNSGIKTVWTIEPFSHSIWVTNERETKLFHNAKIESEGITVDFQKIFGGDLSLPA
jgi:Uma2 family endonuclease